jgi:ATP-dependent DNA helicase RecG
MAEVYVQIKNRLRDGSQAYFVYPLIDESEKMDLKTAIGMYEHFQKHVFSDFRIGLIHGRLSKEETQTIMRAFQQREIDILVATTVVEVGLDVPNANVMVIEHAERFGLSQLHQLRGRVGRGQKDSLCILVGDPKNAEGMKRLEAIQSTNDGFKIAQKDLMLRGPGHFFGRHQHGFSELKVANPATQLDILSLARKEAVALTRQDPRLEKEEHRAIKAVIQRRYPSYLKMVQAG